MKATNRKLRWALAIGGGALLLALAFVLPHHRPFQMPGPEAKFCFSLSHGLRSIGFTNAASDLSHWASKIDRKRLDAALSSGRLVSVSFVNPGIDNAEIGNRAFAYGKSNGFGVVMARYTPNQVDLIVESRGKAQMKQFVRELKKQVRSVRE